MWFLTNWLRCYILLCLRTLLYFFSLIYKFWWMNAGSYIPDHPSGRRSYGCWQCGLTERRHRRMDSLRRYRVPIRSAPASAILYSIKINTNILITQRTVSIIFFILVSIEFVVRFHFDSPIREQDGFTPSVQNGWPFLPNSSLSAKEQEQNLEKKKLFALDFKLKLLFIGMGISVLCIMIRYVFDSIVSCFGLVWLTCDYFIERYTERSSSPAGLTATSSATNSHSVSPSRLYHFLLFLFSNFRRHMRRHDDPHRHLGPQHLPSKLPPPPTTIQHQHLSERQWRRPREHV